MKLGRETETVEYKRTTGELKEGVISIVAILNKHNSGELYFGIRNDGVAVGQSISDKTLRDVSQAIANHIEPHIFPSVNNVVIDNKDCIHVVFEGDNVPYYAYGRAYLRVADEDKVMSPQELESYIIKKNADMNKWDSEASDKTIDDVNDEALREYIEQANAAGRIEYPYSNKKDILKRLTLLNGKNITNAADVMFSHNAGIEVQMATFASNIKLTFIDIRSESGTITELAKKAEKYIKDTIRWRVEFDGSLQRKEIPEVPIEAIREALVNSFCHRDYRIHQINEVAIFKNRIEIYNPGTFPAGLTPQDFIDGSERSIQRNPSLAQILYYSKDIERFGTGLQRIAALCQEANVKVEFKALKLGFAVVFYRSEDGAIETNSEPQFTEKFTDEFAEKFTGNETQRKILEMMLSNPKVGRAAIAEQIGITTRGVQKSIDGLKAAGLIERVGSAKGGHWVVKPPSNPK
jgi:ATP-dependent DNA helicase RecG